MDVKVKVEVLRDQLQFGFLTSRQGNADLFPFVFYDSPPHSPTSLCVLPKKQPLDHTFAGSLRELSEVLYLELQVVRKEKETKRDGRTESND